jgi:hypothetical protein
MSTEQDAKKVEAIIYSPVVSTDSTSPEAQLMRDAKKTQAQADVDTKFDAQVERFRDRTETISIPLLGTAVAMSLFALSIVYTGWGRGRG